MKPDEIYSLDSYDYDLPESMIAPEPLSVRTSSKLLVLSRKDGEISDRGFRDLKDYLKKGDMLVFNDSRVIKARLKAAKKTKGKVEMLLLRPFGAGGKHYDVESRKWQALISPAKSLDAGMDLDIPDAKITILERCGDGVFLVEFAGMERDFGLGRYLEEKGAVPLPPYIERCRKSGGFKGREDDGSRYQNVYARPPGSVAAPTAGFHFDGKFIEELIGMGVKTAFVTLHVGLGTFKPVKASDIREHRMDREWYFCESSVIEKIKETRSNNGRVVAVGTTSVRVLETVFGNKGRASGFTDLFIRPGFEFRAVDAMITNFHLPKSTLLMLVSTFAGRKNVMDAYGHAVKNGYRFYSYGDAMLII